MRHFAALTLLLCALAAPAVVRAQSDDSVAATLESEARERVASERMALGLASGRIDSIEAAHLAHLLERLRNYQDAAYDDDVVSRRERAHLRRLANRLDRAINRAFAR
jgi:hypothetical protein